MMMKRCPRGDSALQLGFYGTSCPNLETIVANRMQDAINGDSRVAASITRLFFHDCFVQGCDASVLLDDTSTFTGEKGAVPNVNSLRGFDVIDAIKAQIEAACPAVVSCADIIALASRDAVSLSGGPNWQVPLGRRDSRTASLQLANSVLPSPFFNVSVLLSNFAAQGLTARDLVALSGAHTFGQARCRFFRARLYNDTGNGDPDPTLNRYYRLVLQDGCPQQGEGGDDNLAMLDPYTPTTFDNRYFVNLRILRGLLPSDQTLYSSTDSSTTQQVVLSYVNDNSLFFSDFVTAMLKMGSINPLTGDQGEIRLNCRKIN
ncbi:hypothetical protein KP509_04G088500 [Ceratopteris richardii]|nr:hypothetical protein KP509_04G088500 [Ceratopteris richardii]